MNDNFESKEEYIKYLILKKHQLKSVCDNSSEEKIKLNGLIPSDLLKNLLLTATYAINEVSRYEKLLLDSVATLKKEMEGLEKFEWVSVVNGILEGDWPWKKRT